jgi:dienelactone hydrolase
VGRARAPSLPSSGVSSLESLTYGAAIMNRIIRVLGSLVLAVAVASGLWAGGGGGDKAKGLAEKLRALEPRIAPWEAGAEALQVRALRDAANRRETKAWQALKNRADWERYRDARLAALRASLGTFPPAPKDLKVRVTRTLAGEGHKVENLVFESRPGLVVTANLYLPDPPVRSMPGILICHSHHNPKSQGELQDMGMTWARLGCAVLVLDQLGHGERRQHPFTDAGKFPGKFQPGRQDYYFRYNVGNQFQVIGDSLMGWMVWDLSRGVDLLLSRPGIDKDRIILLGAVAGGGDPCAVTAALDRRIAAAVPFNFGGPQPETRHPLPKDAEDRFNYAGGGSWESTRNLRLSARDGFLPWVIVGAVAPRGLVYAHEFAWDRERDPVWQRLEKIYGWYGARDRLASVAGKGSVSGMAPESTHCNNIGAVHRHQIYPALRHWFNIPSPEKDYQKRRPAADLVCLTPEVAAALQPRPVHRLAAEIGAERAAAARMRLEKLAPAEKAERLRQDWARLLGKVERPTAPRATVLKVEKLGDVTVERLVLGYPKGDEADVTVSAILLAPPRANGKRLPVVVGLAQEGRAGLLRHRADVIAALLEGGAAVCLPDLRRTGEMHPADDGRGRRSGTTGLSATEWMLGRTLLGGHVRDLRLVLQALRARRDLDGSRIALWGDSLAPVNTPTENLAVPWDAARLPRQAEPLGGLLALFGALYEPEVQAVYARGGLSGHHALLGSPFLYVPHDVLVPGTLTAGDLCDVAGALAPRPLRLEGLVDGLNRRVPAGELNTTYAPARASYRAAGELASLSLSSEPAPPGDAARWLLARLKGK